jgi:steroid delta-isomerase-like uncharacterized protein
MSADTNRVLARRFFEELCNGRNLALADELLTPDHVYHDPQIPNVRGAWAAADTVAVYQNSLEGHWEVHEIFAAENDRVVARWTGTGKHVGELNGIPPTGRSVRASALSLFRVENGKLAEHWCVWDTLGMLQQLGVVPDPSGVQA